MTDDESAPTYSPLKSGVAFSSKSEIIETPAEDGFTGLPSMRSSSSRKRTGRYRTQKRLVTRTTVDLLGLEVSQEHSLPYSHYSSVPSKASASTLVLSQSHLEHTDTFRAEANQIAELVELGYTVDMISEMIYLHLQDQRCPLFLDTVYLDPDGGLDRVDEIWTNQKLFWCILLFVSVLYNVIYLLSTNWIVFRGFVLDFALVQEATLQVVGGNMTWGDILNQTEIVEEKAAARAATGNIYMQIQDPSRRFKILAMAGVVGTAEVVWVFLAIVTCFYQFGEFLLRRSEFRAYYAITQMFQESLPVLSTFSLLRLVSVVHPALIYSKYLDMLNHSVLGSHTWRGPALTTVYFILSRSVCVLLAFQAFAVKLVSCALRLMDHNHEYMACLFSVIGLMNQCIGCIMFERILQDRIFLFIFGGADTQYEFDELAYRNVYRSRLSKVIWEEYWSSGEKLKAIALLATLDHYDMQRLLLDEHKLYESYKSKSLFSLAVP